MKKKYFPAIELKWTVEILMKISRNDGDAGEKTINDYLKQHPKSVDAFYAKGKCLTITQRQSESIEYYDKAIRGINNRDELSNLTLNQIILDKITALLDINNIDESLRIIENFKESNKKEKAVILYLKSRVYLLQKDYEKAIKYANDSLKVKKTSEAYYYRANGYFFLEKYYSSALDFMRSKNNAIETTPLDMIIDSHYKCGLSFEKLEKYQTAVEYFNETINFKALNLTEENNAKIEDAQKIKNELITYYNVKDRSLTYRIPLLPILFIIFLIAFIILHVTNTQYIILKYIFLIIIILFIMKFIYLMIKI